MEIRSAQSSDADALCDLYSNHLTSRPPQEPPQLTLWEEKLARFKDDPHYHLLIGEADDHIVSSVTLVVIENLTRNLRPYAIVENVVTHKNHRGKGYAKTLMIEASTIAAELNCYKIMLMTGAKEDSTLHFYESCGFNDTDKTAFIKWL